MEQYIIKISADYSGKRLDLFLADFSKEKKLGLSRTAIQKLVISGNIYINNLGIMKPHQRIKTNDEIKIYFEKKKPSQLKAENLPIDIIYEDEDLAIINKPSGMVVHPAVGNCEHTLVNALLYHFKELSGVNPQRPGIVHRLDKDTSGLLVVAKNDSAHLALAQQFAKHDIKRKYIALVKGSVEFDEDVIELPIGRHPLKRMNMSAGFGRNIKYAKTYYRTKKRAFNYSLLELEPFTGRTHQLRVHLFSLGHPILGDVKYGKNNEFSRLALHAEYLGFIHPRSGKFVEFFSDTPIEIAEFLNQQNSK